MENFKEGYYVRITRTHGIWKEGDVFRVDKVVSNVLYDQDGEYAYSDDVELVINKDAAIEYVKNRDSQKWISVKEQMPDENVGVLVFIPEEDYHVTSGMWDVSQKWVLLDEYRIPTSEVTHWMPMPDISAIKDTPYAETEIIEDRNIEFILDSHYPNTRTVYRKAILKAMEEYKDWFIAAFRLDLKPENEMRFYFSKMVAGRCNVAVEFNPIDKFYKLLMWRDGENAIDQGVIITFLEFNDNLKKDVAESFEKWINYKGWPTKY